MRRTLDASKSVIRQAFIPDLSFGSSTCRSDHLEITTLMFILECRPGVAVVSPAEHPLILPIYRHICQSHGSGCKAEKSLGECVASPEAR
eukprot:3875044-Amphidinium_carterae.1